MSKKVEQLVAELVKDQIAGLGYELVDVEFDKKKGRDSELILYIDKEGGVNLDDCEKVSTAVDPLIDRLDPVEGSYILSVSSPGVDRPYKSDRDFEKNIGKKVEVRLYEKLQGKKEIVALLLEKKADFVVLEEKKLGRMELPLEKIALIRTHIEF